MSVIKKIVVMILIAALCLSGAALAEEESGIAVADCLDEWVERETQFTQMTIEMNPESGLDVEIAAPLTHGAYIFKTTIQYDGDQRCFTYDKGKFRDVLITEEENPEMGENDAAVYTVSFGLYEYALLLNETYTECSEHSDSGYFGDLTVKSAGFAGLSHYAAELRYHADGAIDAENDPWGEYTALMDMITGALSGENPKEAIQALTEAMPEQAEEIRMLAEIFSALSEQNEE